jgi:hypothetical protein
MRFLLIDGAGVILKQCPGWLRKDEEEMPVNRV